MAVTSDGKIFRRIGDQCIPVRVEDILQLSEEKGIYLWELVKTKYTINDTPSINIDIFVMSIRESSRVSPFIKEKTDLEILENYHLIDDGYLTNIGVLWLGNAYLRARLTYPITVLYNVYDHLENKVRGYGWHDHTFSPSELLLDIEREAIELRYFHEFSTGLFRKRIPHYNAKLIRELLINAFAHRSFTISQDIRIDVYPDRLEISNPGGLPAGITANNILHTQNRRNPCMIEILKALGLMEGEGSGYDLMYQLNAMEAKKQPTIEADYGTVKVIQSSAIIDSDILPLLDYVRNHFELTQKGSIAFGVIAQEHKILSTELSKKLQLSSQDKLKNYTSKLLEDKLIITEGNKKGTSYSVNPSLIQNSRANIKTTLKTIAKHTLKALVLEDLKLNPNSKIKDISERLPDVPMQTLRTMIYHLVKEGQLQHTDAKRNRTYRLNSKS
ncbi:MAG: ATP-binding protein [Akkermansia sp.]